MYWYPPVQVSHFEINNATIDATLENQYRSTLAQILGGGAVAIGIYFAWNNFKIAQENLKVSQEGQITERFTKAIEQLGNDKLQIRLGGIYALERISKESKKDYWTIMEILTAYIRENSPVKDDNLEVEATENHNEAPLNTEVKADIQAILTVIVRRNDLIKTGKPIYLNLRKTYLQKADLCGANLKGVDFYGADLTEAHLEVANLEGANFIGANLKGAYLERVNLEEIEETDYRKRTLHFLLNQFDKTPDNLQL